MTINLDEWKLLDENIRNRGEISTEIEMFLKQNKDKAFTIKEIREVLKKKFPSYNPKISVILNTLKNYKIVEHKSPYWKIKSEGEKLC